MNLTRAQISDQLDIQDPFLMIDEIILDLEEKTAKSKKILNNKEWFYSCHLTKSPAMPATLQMEGMLQTMAMLIYNLIDHKFEKSYIVDSRTRFFAKVYNQPLINYQAELTSYKRGIFKGLVHGSYEGTKICEGDFTYASPSLMSLPKRGSK